MDRKFKYDTQWGFKTETEMFRHIWDNNPHFSFISGLQIRNPTSSNFAHVLAKGINKYPHFRLNPDNIVLVTQDEHHLIDNGTEDKRKKYCKRIKTASFKPFYKKEDELKRLYKIAYPS